MPRVGTAVLFGVAISATSAFAAQRASAADSVSVTFKRGHLVDRKIPLAKDFWEKASGKKDVKAPDSPISVKVSESCTLVFSAVEVSDGGGTAACKDLWGALAPTQTSFVAQGTAPFKDGTTVVVAPTSTVQPAETSVTSKVADGVLTINGAEPEYVYWFDSTSDARKWHKLSPKAGTSNQFELPAALTAKLAGTNTKPGFEQPVILAKGDAETSLVVKPEKQKASPPPPPPPLPANWCPAPKVGSYVVCVDAYSSQVSGGGAKRVDVKAPDDAEDQANRVLRPNQTVIVFVAHLVGEDVEVEMEGDIGLFVPGDQDKTTSPSTPTPQSEGDKPKALWSVHSHEFAPRKPGKAPVKVSLKKGTDTKNYTVEFVVEQTFLGAVRVGIGLVGGGAVERGYEARAIGGSSQSEVAVKSRGRVDIELVLGYSVYWERNGRGYVTGCYPWCFGPYVGLGILNQSPTALETLKSLYIGAEWEPTPNFSVGFTLVGRRVTRLADGFAVGSPVTGDVPTTTGYDLGWAFVFNVSPEFLRVAKSASTGFFK